MSVIPWFIATMLCAFALLIFGVFPAEIIFTGIVISTAVGLFIQMVTGGDDL